MIKYKMYINSVQICCSVMSDSATPWTVAHQASLSFTISWSLLRLTSIELVMPSNLVQSENAFKLLKVMNTIFKLVRCLKTQGLGKE